MQIKHLEAFVKVADLKSFTRAAQELFLTQPAISMQIKALEEELGVELFRRRERRVELTAAGNILYSEAKEILAAYYRLLSRLEVLNHPRSSYLCLGASTIPGEYLLPQLIGSFRHLYPEVQVDLRIAPTATVIRMLREREVSLAACGARLPGTDIVYRPWLEDEVVVVLPVGQHTSAGRGGEQSGGSLEAEIEITWDELREMPVVLREPGSGTREFVAQFLHAAGVELADLSIAMEASTNRAVLAAVAGGIGAGFVSLLAARDAAALGRVRIARITGLVMKRYLYLAWLENEKLPPVVELFRQFLLSGSREGGIVEND